MGFGDLALLDVLVQLQHIHSSVFPLNLSEPGTIRTVFRPDGSSLVSPNWLAYRTFAKAYNRPRRAFTH